MPLYIQGQAVQTKNMDTPVALAKAINQANAGVEAVFNSTGELIITNNVKSNDISINISQLPLNDGLTGLPLFIKDGSTWKEIDTASSNTPEELVIAINSAGAGVQARLSGSDLIISRTASRAGEDISISSEASETPQTNATTALGIAPRTFKVANAGDDISVSATLSDNPGITSITALGISSTTFRGKVDLIKPAIDAVTIETSKIDLGTAPNTKGLMINGQTIDLGNIQIPSITNMSAYRAAMINIAKAINDKAGTTQVTARLSLDSSILILGSVASDVNPKIRITGNFVRDSNGAPVSNTDDVAHVPQSGSNLGQDSLKNSQDQYTYQDSIFVKEIANGSWPAEPINTVIIKKDQVRFDKPLFIKDAGVWKKVNMYGVDEKLGELANRINLSGAGVIAKVNALGDLEIRNDEQHRGQDIRTSAVASDATGTSLVTALGQIATTFRVKYDFKPSGPIQLGFGAGSPNQLAQLGFRTGAFVSGEVKDDLLIFVTGPGNAAVSATYSGQAADPKQNLRGQILDVKFFQDPAKYKGALYYTISSKDATKPGLGATVVAERVFDPEQLNPGVSFQGLNISFTGVPRVNDVFTLDGNKDGLGNNDNLLSISELETKAVVGSKTLTNSYIDQVNEMGNIARQAAISQTALKVVNEQALKSRDEISGVSLDKEAADLIRYQQAYQASAKVLQIASQLFEAVLRV